MSSQKIQQPCMWCQTIVCVETKNWQRSFVYPKYQCRKCAAQLKNKRHWTERACRKILRNEPLSWTEYLLYNPCTKNVKVQINCTICSKASSANSKKLSNRKHIKTEVCNTCILKATTNTALWKETNSQAQLLIQSTPEQKAKNAKGVADFWATHPEVKERVRQKLIQKMQDPVYKKKWLDSIKDNQPHALSGKFLFRERQWIHYGSSYELCFLVWAEGNLDIQHIRRCDFFIEYTYDKVRHYNPDYIVVWQNSTKSLVEIKSVKWKHYDEAKVLAKNKAAKQFIVNHDIQDFLFITENHPWADAIHFRRTARIKSLVRSLHRQNKITLSNTKQRDKYIGKT
jgi:hypothetical protein